MAETCRSQKLIDKQNITNDTDLIDFSDPKCLNLATLPWTSECFYSLDKGCYGRGKGQNF